MTVKFNIKTTRSLYDIVCHVLQGLAVVAGDGALCRGGTSAHPSTGAAEKLFRAIHPTSPTAFTSWDRFHRLDNSVWKAVQASPAAEEVFDVAAALDSLFGVSEGKTLLRGISALVGESARTTRRAGGTRKVGYLSGVPGHLLCKPEALHSGDPLPDHLEKERRLGLISIV